jgi:recombination protein RecR
MMYPEELLRLIALFRQLPGVGTKTAERFAFHLLQWTPQQLLSFSDALRQASQRITHCLECGCLAMGGRCDFCHHPHRDRTLLCVVASHKDALTIEQTRSFQGLYHVLGGLLSPLDGMDTGHLRLLELKKRIGAMNIQEVIVALDSTIEGETTALHIKNDLKGIPLRISRLALGMPIGSTLDYIDGGTLSKALQGRQFF